MVNSESKIHWIEIVFIQTTIAQMSSKLHDSQCLCIHRITPTIVNLNFHRKKYTCIDCQNLVVYIKSIKRKIENRLRLGVKLLFLLFTNVSLLFIESFKMEEDDDLAVTLQIIEGNFFAPISKKNVLRIKQKIYENIYKIDSDWFQYTQ